MCEALLMARNVLLLLLSVTGGALVCDNLIGDGPIPPLYALERTAPELRDGLTRPYPASLGMGSTEADFWQALQPTLKILNAISPEIAEWLISLHKQGNIEYQLTDWQKNYQAAATIQSIATYDPQRGRLHIAPRFWTLNQGESATFLVHEYRHARQNFPKVIATTMAQILSGKLYVYGSVVEDEAYLYQLDAYQALNISPSSIWDYLDRRGLVHFKKYDMPLVLKMEPIKAAKTSPGKATK